MTEKKQWTGHDDHWHPVGETTLLLPPGVYAAQTGFQGPYLKAIKPLSDKPILVDDGLSHQVFEGIKAFWAAKDKYAAYGLIHKRGVLMEGAPGTGKTVVCQLLTNEVTREGGYALITQPYDDIWLMEWALGAIRGAHPQAPLVSIIEDVNEHRDHDLSQLLAVLDGENQISNVVHIATTNFYKQLDSRLTNRPSRFDEVIHVNPPSAKARESYITQIIPVAERDIATIESLVKSSEGLMLAHLRELVISVCVLGHPVAAVSKRLLDMNKAAKDAEATADDGEIEAQIVTVRKNKRKQKLPMSPVGTA